jgi:hypothetical protein
MAKKSVPTFTKEEFMAALRDVATKSAEELVTMGEKMHGKLTEDELADLATYDGQQGVYRLVKTLVVAFGGETLERAWNAESIKPKVRKVKGIDKRRY